MTLKMPDGEIGLCKIAVITCSTQPGRKNEAIAKWVCSVSGRRKDAAVELVNVASYNLPRLDRLGPALHHQYSHEHTKGWSAKIASFDAYIFVTPEYSHSLTGALKNAIDYLYHEWHDKAAGLVSYGAQAEGARATERLRSAMAALRIATVPAQVVLSLLTDFEDFKAFKPGPQRDNELGTMLDQLVAWGTALKTMRCDAA